MNPNKPMWGKGDLTHIAAAMRESGEALVDGLGVTLGRDVERLVRRTAFHPALTFGRSRPAPVVEGPLHGVEPSTDLDPRRTLARWLMLL